MLNFTCATLPFVRISIQRLLCKPPKKETNDYSGRCATISYCVNTPFTVLTTVPTTPVSTCLHARDESAGYDCYLPVFHPRCIQRTALKFLRYDTNASIHCRALLKAQASGPGVDNARFARRIQDIHVDNFYVV